jgi:hypothetical protein
MLFRTEDIYNFLILVLVNYNYFTHLCHTPAPEFQFIVLSGFCLSVGYCGMRTRLNLKTGSRITSNHTNDRKTHSFKKKG